MKKIEIQARYLVEVLHFLFLNKNPTRAKPNPKKMNKDSQLDIKLTKLNNLHVISS
jgi:hypothetical protein